jgi:hypothetical protein
MTRRRIALVAILLLVGGVGAWLLRGNIRSVRGTVPASALTPEERVAMLENSLKALEDGVRGAPRDHWDPEYVVAQVGRNPEALFHWVQDNTSWIPYRGVLRGPAGVLMDRQGNSLDRALLLAELLTRAGHSVRLARTEIPIERAEALLPELVAMAPDRNRLEEVVADTVPISVSAEGYGLDGKAVEQTLESYDEATADLLQRVEERVASQTKRLLETVDAIGPFAEWNSRADSALAMLRDHWWVQVETDGSWSDLDVVRRDSAESMRAVLETSPPEQVDASLHHQVTIRVVTERFTQGRLVEERVLEHTLRPGDVIGQPIVLQFWPSDWPALEAMTGQTARSIRKIALEQDGWSAALVAGNEAVATAMLDASAGAARPASGIGGLGGAMANALTPRSDGEDDQLTATSIEFVIDVPGRKSRVVRRSVFDLIGPAARQAGVTALTLDEEQKLRRSLSLMMRTEILPLGAQPNADFVAYLAGRNMLANAHLLRAVIQPSFGLDGRMTDSLLKTAEPVVGPLHALAVLRHEAIHSAVFLDQPTILTRHRFPQVVGDSVGLVDATDIVANEVGIALSESDGFMARLAQGTWDTNLEAMLGLVGGPAGNAAAAFEESRNWLPLTRDDTSRLHELELPADVLTRIGQDLESGYTVVVPQRPVTVDRQEFSAWWRIDPHTGDALGMGENGWGQGAEYGNLARNILIVGGRAFVFEYGLCQFIPQVANSLNVIGGEFWRLGLAPSWTTPPAAGKDFEDVAAENNTVCLKQAMLQGFLATAPLLLATARYAAITRVSYFARQQAAYETGWQAAIGRFRAARGFCLCTPREFRTGLQKAQVRGGPAVPNVDPLGKTQPIQTQPMAPPPSTPRQLTAVENVRRAEEAARAANSAANKAINDFLQYRRNMTRMGRPLDPYQDRLFVKRVQEMDQEAVKAIHELRAAEAGLSSEQRVERAAMKEWQNLEARKAHPQVKFEQDAPPVAPPAPKLPGCPPNCGNEKATVDAQAPAPSNAPAPASSNGALNVGSTTIVNGFFQGRWPTGNR